MSKNSLTLDSATLQPKNGIFLVDTHCHIHDDEFKDRFKGIGPDEMIKNANSSDVKKLICVGTDLSSSQKAIEFCRERPNCFASVALHPHEAEGRTDEELEKEIEEIDNLIKSSPAGAGVVAIGECGLDYFYHDDPKTHKMQEKLLRMHIELVLRYKLPLIFHIRDPKNQSHDELGAAFKDFFRIVDDYIDITGVVHSFSAGMRELKGAIKRGFYIGLNGIITFTRNAYQLDAAKAVPIEKLVLETDAPFLTPKPFRGKMCEPKHVRVTAEFLSDLRGESLDKISKETTANAETLFGI